MFFERSRDKITAQPNEYERRRSTDNVLNQTSDILQMPEVQDALGRLSMSRIPNLLQKMYVPFVENGEIIANRSTDLVPIVSIFPKEKLTLKNTPVSMDLYDNIIGMTIDRPQILVALAQKNANNPTAPMTAIHELAHVHQLTYKTVNRAAYVRYPHFGSPKEVEALNVEAVVANVLISSRNNRWSGNTRILTDLTRQIRSRLPVFPASDFRE